jgi:hypothetical protein
MFTLHLARTNKHFGITKILPFPTLTNGRFLINFAVEPIAVLKSHFAPAYRHPNYPVNFKNKIRGRTRDLCLFELNTKLVDSLEILMNFLFFNQ